MLDTKLKAINQEERWFLCDEEYDLNLGSRIDIK